MQCTLIYITIAINYFGQFMAFSMPIIYNSTFSSNDAGDDQLDDQALSYFKDAYKLTTLSWCNSKIMKKELRNFDETSSLTTLRSDKPLEDKIMIAVLPQSHSIVVAFRGTKIFAMSQWIGNFQHDLTTWPTTSHFPTEDNPMVHKGFLRGYDALREALFDHLYDLLFIQGYATYKVRFMGHSRGGPLAALAAVDFCEWQEKDSLIDIQSELFTVGATRVGNHAFGVYATKLFKTHGLKAYRLVNENDPLVHWPPIQKGYQHFGNEIWIQPAASGEEAVVKFCKTSVVELEDPSCSLSSKRRNWASHAYGFGVFHLQQCIDNKR